jgi:hypothetical protein
MGDRRKDAPGGIKTQKAGAFDGLDFEDFWSPVQLPPGEAPWYE